jgi:DNA repair exonuclease SbcCD ATPase subunit
MAHQPANQSLGSDVVPLADSIDGRTATDLDLELQAMASSLDASELESERRMLAERKNELDRRQATLQRMQSDTQAMHREALEMRLVTEQLWVEISDQAAPEHVQELLNSLRARLDEHYAEQQSGIDNQASELVTLKETIEQKQEELRSQSAQLQQWVEDRHDEIKSYAAEVDAREMLLDRREHRMHEEFSKWEATRNAYQKQLQGILKNLDH